MDVELKRAPEGKLLLHDVEVDGIDYSGRSFWNLSVADGSRLSRCDFSGTTITGTGLGGGRRPSEYIDCRFDGSTLAGIAPGRATFRGCSFRNVRMRNMFFVNAQFIDCTISGKLKTIVFTAEPWSKDAELGRSRNDYRGNDFTGADLDDVAFRGGIDLGLQRLPGGSDYALIRDAGQVVLRALDEVKRWPDDRRGEAEAVLATLLMDIRGGQSDIFVRPSQLFIHTPAVAERLAELLTYRER